jgi:hypothetical protein
VSMVEGGQHACFPLKTSETVGVTRERARQHLDRNVAPKLRIACSVYLL